MNEIKYNDYPMENWAKLPGMHNEISIIPSQDIDREKWDRCITESPNGLIYSSSIYLDHLADNWTGIVLRDYETVMAVPWRKKAGIKYCYHVPFIQQLGIVCRNRPSDHSGFLIALKHVCRYGTYPFNYRNNIERTTSHTNFILPLDRTYESLSKGFSADVLQNIKRSQEQGLSYGDGDPDEAIEQFRRLYEQQIRVSSEHFEKYKTLCRKLAENGNCTVKKVTGANGGIQAIALLPKDSRRIYNIMNSTFPDGKTTEANYYLLSSLWKEFEETGMVFDFEGSDLPGVRDFYKKFGGTNQPYFKLHFNHLPWPMKILKK